jgi:hypothetical protein
MRTRLVAAMTAAMLAVPLFSAAAGASSPQHKCEKAMGVEHKCQKPKK